MTSGHLRVNIVGAAGYTGGELLRILLYHPHTGKITAVSASQKGLPVNSVHQDILNDDLLFAEDADEHADITFLCMGHGKSREWIEQNSVGGNIIDLSHDFRLKQNSDGFVYGLPEFQKTDIVNASKVANPGCFATAMQLALLPLVKEGFIRESVHINGITGSTGAGQSLSATSHFSWRNNNISLYKVFEHQHMHEVRETLCTLQPGLPELFFVPVRGNFTRGIFISAYTSFEGSEKSAKDLFADYYHDAAFTFLRDQELHLKQVINSNNCLVHVMVRKGQVMVTSIIDNLLKGASGQAVQNMNLMFGLEETSGLQLKSSYF